MGGCYLVGKTDERLGCGKSGDFKLLWPSTLTMRSSFIIVTAGGATPCEKRGQNYQGMRKQATADTLNGQEANRIRV